MLKSGVSGLATISQLAQAYNVTNTLLIEGADRLGGRVHTIPFGNGSHIELGAQVTINKLLNPLLPFKKYLK